jgi:Tol biopolymer transport system component
MKPMKSWISVLLVGFATALAGHAAPPAVASTAPAPTGSGAGNSFNPVFSADRRHLIFVSHANNMVINDDVAPWLDVFARDLVTSNTVLVSRSTNGFGGANADANYPSISSNGQFIAFASRASNLASNTYYSDGFNSFLYLDENNASDIFLRDLNTGVTRPVSVADNDRAPSDPQPASNVPLCSNPQISADGRWVFFQSRATDIAFPPFPSAGVNIYARDMLSNITVLVTVDTNGNPITGNSELTGITPDARFAVFTTTNSRIASGVPPAPDTSTEVYVRDMQTARTIWVSTNVPSIIFSGGYRGSRPVLSDDGRFAAFIVTPLYPSFQDERYVLRHDLQNGATAVLSSNATNVSHGIQISADGSRVLFEEATNGVAKVRLRPRERTSTSDATWVAMRGTHP